MNNDDSNPYARKPKKGDVVVPKVDESLAMLVHYNDETGQISGQIHLVDVMPQPQLLPPPPAPDKRSGHARPRKVSVAPASCRACPRDGRDTPPRDCQLCATATAPLLLAPHTCAGPPPIPPLTRFMIRASDMLFLDRPVTWQPLKDLDLSARLPALLALTLDVAKKSEHSFAASPLATVPVTLKVVNSSSELDVCFTFEVSDRGSGHPGIVPCGTRVSARVGTRGKGCTTLCLLRLHWLRVHAIGGLLEADERSPPSPAWCRCSAA